MAVATASKPALNPKGALPAAPVTPAAATPSRANLRDTQNKKISVDRMKPVGYFFEPQQIMIKAGWELEDVLKPEFWSFIAPNLQANPSASVMQDRIGTVIHVHTEDHAYYALLYVNALARNSQGQANALKVTCIGPCVDPATGRACAVDVNTGLPWKGRADAGGEN